MKGKSKKMEIKEIIEKYGITLCRKNTMLALSNRRKYSQAEIKMIKEKKAAIIEAIATEEKQKEIDRIAEYSEIKKALPERKIISGNNDELAQEILGQMRKYFKGAEMEGVNISIAAKNEKIRKEAMQYCNHDLKTKIDYTLTFDARKKITRIISCPKCGLEVFDTVESKN